MTDRVVGWRLLRYERLGSTMDEVARLAAAAEPEGTVVVAAEQTAGRGRAGRSWRAPAGTALLCSVLLRPNVPPDRLGLLPLVVGVGVAEAIEEVTALRTRLKWPNDVWLGSGPVGRKVAGVLLAARSHGSAVGHAVVGVGVNANIAPADLPPGATSLLAETGRPVHLARLLDRLLVRLDAAYREYLAADGQPGLAGWRDRAALLDHPVAVVRDGQTLAGTMRGVAADGALLLERDDGTIERIVAGDLVRGPVRRARPTR